MSKYIATQISNPAVTVELDEQGLETYKTHPALRNKYTFQQIHAEETPPEAKPEKSADKKAEAKSTKKGRPTKTK